MKPGLSYEGIVSYVADLLRHKGEEDARRSCEDFERNVSLDARKLFDAAKAKLALSEG